MLPSVRVVFNIPPTLSPTPKPTFAMPTSVPWPSLLSNGQPGFVALVVITIIIPILCCFGVCYQYHQIHIANSYNRFNPEINPEFVSANKSEFVSGNINELEQGERESNERKSFIGSVQVVEND